MSLSRTEAKEELPISQTLLRPAHGHRRYERSAMQRPRNSRLPSTIASCAIPILGRKGFSERSQSAGASI